MQYFEISFWLLPWHQFFRFFFCHLYKICWWNILQPWNFRQDLMQDLTASIIPLSWKVFFLSIILALWSTLWHPAQISFDARPDLEYLYPGMQLHIFSNSKISAYGNENPWLYNDSIRNFEPNSWCICTPSPSWRGTRIRVGKVSSIIAWPTDAMLVSALFACSSVKRRKRIEYVKSCRFSWQDSMLADDGYSFLVEVAFWNYDWEVHTPMYHMKAYEI